MTQPMERLSAALADRYAIERELGAGGMATVYLAEDLKHHRKVAVKVLRPELAATLGPERFMQEIEIAARLQHPHILPVHDSGTTTPHPERGEGSQSFLYYVMPYVEGESLRDRLSHHGELPIHDAVRLLAEITEALAYAHRQGVVHRDIKPENIMLSGRHALVMDFGVAKAVSEASGRNRLTTAGVALGTPTYMAPEQASADPNLDQRVDIYALGVLGYELLAGRPPFTGVTAQQILAAHVTQTPDPVTMYRPTTSPALAAVIMRALQKRPADRWQTADEMLAQLEPLLTPSGGMTPTHTIPIVRSRVRWPLTLAIAALILCIGGFAYWRTHREASLAFRAIAVLPFDNTSGDTTFNYLADGIADDLRTGLTTGLTGITVKARSSSIRAKGRSIHDAGALLGADVIVQGAVRRTLDSTTITVDLVNVANEASLWSGKYSRRTGANLASVQDSITAAVARTLHVNGVADAPSATAQHGTSDQQAYDLFLQGTYRAERLDYAGAADLLRQAVARDSNFARAYAQLAYAYAALPDGGFASNDSAMALAEVAERHAERLDSASSDVKWARVSLLMDQMRDAEARPIVADLLRRDPASEPGRVAAATLFSDAGQLDSALNEVRQAHLLDPLDPDPLTATQYYLYVAGRYRDAVAATPGALELDPRNIYTLQNLGLAYLFLLRPDSAMLAFRHAVSIDSTAFSGRLYTMQGYAALGQWAKAAHERDVVLSEKRNSPNYVATFIDLTFGQYDSAATAWARAIDHREPLVIGWSWNCDPMFDPIKTKPAFVAAAARLGYVICPAKSKWPFPPAPRDGASR